MKLVIDIPEEDYKRMKEQSMFGRADVWRKAIQNGQPIPKGHGRLIDGEEVKRRMGNLDGVGMIGRCIDEFPTIIEADKEESEDNE